MNLAETALSAAVPLAVNSLTKAAEPWPDDDLGLERAFVEAQQQLGRNALEPRSDGWEAVLLFGVLGLVAGLYAGRKL